MYDYDDELWGLGMLGMIGNYEQRVVKNDKTTDFILDTAEVYDRSWIYETAVSHKDFNNGKWIILDGTNTREDALKAHEKWLKALEAGVDSLEDYYDETVYNYGSE